MQGNVTFQPLADAGPAERGPKRSLHIYHGIQKTSQGPHGSPQGHLARAVAADHNLQVSDLHTHAHLPFLTAPQLISLVYLIMSFALM